LRFRAILFGGHIRVFAKTAHPPRAIGVVPQDITPTLASALGWIAIRYHPVGHRAHGAAKPPGWNRRHCPRCRRQTHRAIAPTDGSGFSACLRKEITLDVQRAKSVFRDGCRSCPPRSPEDLEELASRDAHLIRRLGVLALTLDERVTPILPDLRRLSGVVVAAIPAEFAGLNPGLIAGDAIYELNGSRIGTLEELRTALDGKKTEIPLRC